MSYKGCIFGIYKEYINSMTATTKLKEDKGHEQTFFFKENI